MMQSNHMILDLNPPVSSLKEEVLKGLKLNQKQLHPKWFYDEKGTKLFNQITMLPEYYLTRAEKEILTTFHSDICDLIGHNAPLFELGCGSEEKIQLILNSLKRGNRYIPIDISGKALNNTVEKLLLSFPLLDVKAIRADYTQALSFLRQNDKEQKIILFLGSTIGNLNEKERENFLCEIAINLNQQDGLIIGIDLNKSTALLEAAYNDSKGITAAFNKNLLHRINKELSSNFQVNHFEHHAYFNKVHNRIEMHLISKVKQAVSIGDETFSFLPEETIHTENSYKFDLKQFEQSLLKSGLCLRKFWTDKQNYFAVTYIEPISK
ncbi:L-histidine N(alpha)-methyltransferase [Chengkuizengella axinellae]|uniref:L-histidine N(Alpha)-methyltransferase n=1 Tax=Chengkuizengella axinellae TaxID=3064388 RepID=A0ABT9IVL1_9BACL|nr:L-histidine N(alpha)-methyltransferase [Chengkuizengella sp. 2205SS18-9]MDP5273378.1 L-histidine N(alpha)-methyltransferase [Chengkuizengella sp. 2205SS18-9]